MKPPQTIVIVGPTASGKSALAVELARRLNGEIISADSRQVYRALDSGTGKITAREMKGIAHHLLDVASPKKVFTAGDFVTLGRQALESIHARGKVAIICGGTGFYIDALLGRITLQSVEPDPKIRARFAGKSAAQLFALLKKKDPARAAQMDTQSERNNAARLIRALEVALTRGSRVQGLGVKKAELTSLHRTPYTLYPALWLGISWSQTALDKRIAKRLSARLKSGMIAEAKRLHSRGLTYKRMESLGLEYRSLARFLKGAITRQELESELNHDIRRYSKKQLMYWKRNPDIVWLTAPVSTAQAMRALSSSRSA